MARKQRRQRGPRAKVDWGRRLATLPLPAVLLGALGLAIVAGPLVKPGLADADGTTDGYAGIVAGAIERSWLYAVPDAQDESGDVNGRVERARSPDVPAEFDAFIAASYLREDMNTLDPSIWRFDGTRLEIDPRARLIGSAYQGSSGWRGSILYSDRQSLQLLLDERGSTAAWITAPVRPGAPAANRAVNVINPGAEAEAGGNVNQLTFIAASGGPPTAVAT
ncbi:MAG TPA: hypothetical protein VGC46_14560, partial [Allosphingosinicella sp.]